MPPDELLTKRVAILEARLGQLEQRQTTLLAPVLDAFEGMRKDTLSLVEALVTRFDQRQDTLEKKLDTALDFLRDLQSRG